MRRPEFVTRAGLTIGMIIFALAALLLVAVLFAALSGAIFGS